MKNKILIFTVIIGIIFLRFYAVPQFFFFGVDEEYQSLLAFSQIKDFHIIWIGVSQTLGYYLGPGLVYLSAVLLWLTKGDPIVLAYFASILSLFACFSLYFVVRDIYDKKSALIALIIYGFSNLLIFYDRRFWNPTFIPIVSIWFYYSLVKIKTNQYYLIFLSILIGLSYHIHISLWLFWPFVIFVIYENYKKFNWKNISVSILNYLFITSPLIVFDYVHNYDNLLMPLRLFFHKNQTTRPQGFEFFNNVNNVFASIQRVWINNTFGTAIYINGIDWSILGILFLIFSLFILIWIMTKKGRNTRLLSTVMWTFVLFFIFFPGKMLEYYLLGFFPLFIIACALFLSKTNRYLLAFFVGIFISVNIVSFKNSNTNRGLNTKKLLIEKVANIVGNESYSLESKEILGGWRYLFKVYFKSPNYSNTDETFGWIYPDEINSTVPKYKVVVFEDATGYKYTIK